MTREGFGKDDSTVFFAGVAVHARFWDGSERLTQFEDSPETIALENPAKSITLVLACVLNPRLSSSSDKSRVAFTSLVVHPTLVHSADSDDVPKHMESAVPRSIFTEVEHVRIGSMDGAELALVTHASLDRVDMLARSAESWEMAQHGSTTTSISAAIWVPRGTSRAEVIAKVQIELRSATNILISLLFSDHAEYPINTLRNLALQGANATFVCLLDADVMLFRQPGAMRLTDIVTSWERRRTAFVIPAFEEVSRGRGLCDKHGARNKERLARFVQRGSVAVFKQANQPKAHRATDFDKWWTSTKPYEVPFEAQFEPYIIMRLEDLPRSGSASGGKVFDERFEGYGWNKVSFFITAHLAKTSFVVLPNTWVVHCHHDKSRASERFNSDLGYRIANRVRRLEWAYEILRCAFHHLAVLEEERLAAAWGSLGRDNLEVPEPRLADLEQLSHSIVSSDSTHDIRQHSHPRTHARTRCDSPFLVLDALVPPEALLDLVERRSTLATLRGQFLRLFEQQSVQPHHALPALRRRHAPRRACRARHPRSRCVRVLTVADEKRHAVEASTASDQNNRQQGDAPHHRRKTSLHRATETALKQTTRAMHSTPAFLQFPMHHQQHLWWMGAGRPGKSLAEQTAAQTAAQTGMQREASVPCALRAGTYAFASSRASLARSQLGLERARQGPTARSRGGANGHLGQRRKRRGRRRGGGRARAGGMAAVEGKAAEGGETVNVVEYEYLSESDDDGYKYEEVPDSDEDEQDEELFDLGAEETLASIERNVGRLQAKAARKEARTSTESKQDNRVEEDGAEPRQQGKTAGEVEASRTVVRPAVIDDFFRGFLLKLNLSRTLDTFNTEWYEMEAKGKLNEEQVSAVPDIYLRNQELDETVQALRQELARVKGIAEKARSTWDKFRKERDFHRLNHSRVVQEKNKMIDEIKRQKKHYQSFEPTIKQLRAKYELAMKEKMLMKIELRKCEARNESLEMQVRSLEQLENGEPGSEALTNKSLKGKRSTTSKTLPAHNSAGSRSRSSNLSKTSKANTLPAGRGDAEDDGSGGAELPDLDPPNPFLDQTFEKVPTKNLEVIKTFEGHMNAISALAYHPRKQVVATASDDHTWKLWSVPNGDLIMSGEGHVDWVAGLDFNPKGTHLLSSAGDGTVKLWDFEQAACTATLTDHAQPVWDVAWHYTGDFFASCSMDHTAKLWDANRLRVKQTFRGHVDSVNAVVFQPFSSNVCTASGDKTVSMWDSRSGLCIQTFFDHNNACNSLAINLQGDTIASCDADGIVKVWDVRMVKELATLDGGTHALNDICFDRSGKVLAAASDDGTVKMFDLDLNEPVSQLKGHDDAVQAVVFDPSSKFFVSAASDKTFRVWKL
ncbi:Flagellar WD repeat-containing protein Pf20 [Durusdinium trenchii]|uniref:Flagellar WD repeat-containing protein Pf20 n=1 Tax=Durusdinium trenchii TaxID=1381693 RepID=A0ABP0SB29_9DINO